MMVFSLIPVMTYAYDELVMTHDGYLVTVCTESVVPVLEDHAMYDDMSRMGTFDSVVIVASWIERQSSSPGGGQFRAHGFIRGYSNSFQIGASAQMWYGNSRLNLAQPTWRNNGEEAWSTSPWTARAGTARIFAQSHPNFW